MTITLGIVLAAIALIAGLLLILGSRWSALPLAAIAIIALALIQLLPAFGVAI